jgi:hypothetical protein
MAAAARAMRSVGWAGVKPSNHKPRTSRTTRNKGPIRRTIEPPSGDPSQLRRHRLG